MLRRMAHVRRPPVTLIQEIAANHNFDGTAQDGTVGPKTAGGLFVFDGLVRLGSVVSCIALGLADTPVDGDGKTWKLYIVDGLVARLWLSGAGSAAFIYGDVARIPIIVGRKFKLTSTAGATAPLRCDFTVEE